jgi:hypothetical protein
VLRKKLLYTKTSYMLVLKLLHNVVTTGTEVLILGNKRLYVGVEKPKNKPG